MQSHFMKRHQDKAALNADMKMWSFLVLEKDYWKPPPTPHVDDDTETSSSEEDDDDDTVDDEDEDEEDDDLYRRRPSKSPSWKRSTPSRSASKSKQS